MLNNCTETSSACQAKSMTREVAAAVVTVIGGISLDAPNAYSDDDQSIFQKAINGIPYYGIQLCIGSPFQFQPTETVSRDQFACMLVKAIKAGSTTNLSGAIDKYSDEGASKWTNEINVLAANDVIPACSSIQDKFCPSRKISIGEVAYIVNQMVSKSLKEYLPPDISVVNCIIDLPVIFSILTIDSKVSLKVFSFLPKTAFTSPLYWFIFIS